MAKTKRVKALTAEEKKAYLTSYACLDWCPAKSCGQCGIFNQDLERVERRYLEHDWDRVYRRLYQCERLEEVVTGWMLRVLKKRLEENA